MTIDRPENLERKVADERARVAATLDELQRRLTPGQVVDEVLRHGRGTGSDFVANLGRTLAANPVPTALVGVGLLWLLISPRLPTGAPTTPSTDPGDGPSDAKSDA
jgi:hypothetical protein